MQRQYNQKRVVTYTSSNVSRVEQRNNVTKNNVLDISPDDNGLVDSEIGLKAKSIRNSSTYAKVVENNTLEDTNATDKQGDGNVHKQHQLRNQGVGSNFLSHTEFPDAKSAIIMENAEQTKTANTGQRIKTSRRSATFKPFDNTKTPASFHNVNASSYNQEQYHAEMTNGTQFYHQHVPPLYEHIQQQHFTQQPPLNNYIPQRFAQPPHVNNYIPHNYGQRFHMHTAMVPTRSTATAIAPNGAKILIPLDDSKYKIGRSNHDFYEMPHNSNLYALASEGEFESTKSPRPVDTLGSLSDESSESSGSYSESDTEQEAEYEVADAHVTDAIKVISGSGGNIDVQDTAETLVMQTNNNTDNVVEQSARHTETHGQEDNNETDNLKNGKLDTLVNTLDNELENDSLACITENLAPVQITEGSSSLTEHSISVKPKQVVHAIKENEEVSAPNVNRNNPEFKSIPPADVTLTNKRSHAWKNNRKEKRDNTKRKSNPEECMKGSNDELSYVTNAAYTNESMPVDPGGQMYFKTQLVNGGHYQQYPVPESYALDPIQYPQQLQSPNTLSYTHFIHDAYAPPSPGVDYGQVPKSVSGELINLTDTSVPKSQVSIYC